MVSALAFIVGLAIFTFDEAEGLSYFSGDPEACVNCHVMRDQFEGWNHSSHREWATCNSCHNPHTFFRGYYSKAINGWNHSVAFTTGEFPDPIVITERNRRIVVENCLDCHAEITSQILGHGDIRDPDEVACLKCHSDVGH
jgi:cytochrome c nitrite reductase small subunit